MPFGHKEISIEYMHGTAMRIRWEKGLSSMSGMESMPNKRQLCRSYYVLLKPVLCWFVCSFHPTNVVFLASVEIALLVVNR